MNGVYPLERSFFVRFLCPDAARLRDCEFPEWYRWRFSGQELVRDIYLTAQDLNQTRPETPTLRPRAATYAWPTIKRTAGAPVLRSLFGGLFPGGPVGAGSIASTVTGLLR